MPNSHHYQVSVECLLPVFCLYLLILIIDQDIIIRVVTYIFAHVKHRVLYKGTCQRWIFLGEKRGVKDIKMTSVKPFKLC